jgi:hypothetical protein
MSDPTIWTVLSLVLLGAWHGINPGMGWLFAVALGMQEQNGRAVWRALLPLAAGHACAIAAAVAVAALLGQMIPLRQLEWIVAATLLGFGALRLLRHGHPRWTGMRVGSRDLVLWSALMANAHGAGLMIVPVAVNWWQKSAPHHSAHAHSALPGAFGAGVTAFHEFGLLATLAHTIGYLAITGLTAVVVYQKVGLRLLRTAWINLDLVWAATLICTALVVLLS